MKSDACKIIDTIVREHGEEVFLSEGYAARNDLEQTITVAIAEAYEKGRNEGIEEERTRATEEQRDLSEYVDKVRKSQNYRK